MSVLKNLRSLSNMEFYKQAISIRKTITTWLLKDFNTKPNKKSIKMIIKDLDEEDEKILNEVFAKYGKTPNQVFQSGYPQWFVDYERGIISRCLSDIVQNITRANSIYPINENEVELRRSFQDVAIAECYNLYQELQYIVSLFPSDLNRFINLLEEVEKEVVLLKGWRKSGNRTVKEKTK